LHADLNGFKQIGTDFLFSFFVISTQGEITRETRQRLATFSTEFLV